MCVVCTLLLWLSCTGLQFSHLQWLSLPYGQGLVPVLLREPWAQVGSDQVFARDVVTPNCRVLSLYCPLRRFHWQVGPAVMPVICSQPFAGAAVELACVVTIASPSCRGHFEVLVPVGLIEHCHVCDTALDGLLPRVCWMRQIFRKMKRSGAQYWQGQQTLYSLTIPQ